MDQQSSTSSLKETSSCTDNKPVFFTGLSNTAIDLETLIAPLKKLLCKSCKKNLKNFNQDSNDLCNECILNSKKQEIHLHNQSNIPFGSNYSAVTTPNVKRPLLPAPVNPYNSYSPNNDGRESSYKCNVLEDSKNIGSFSDQKPSKQKWRSDLRDRLHTRSKTAPYFHKSDRNNDNLQGPSSLHTPKCNNRRFEQEHVRDNQPLEYSPSFPSSPSTAHSSTERLSQEIWRLFQENKQNEEIFNRKMALRDKLHDILQAKFPSCGLYVVGSSMTGLGARSSDIDMCLMLTDEEVDQQKEAIKILHSVKYLFYKYKFLHDIQVIYAKVPILKFVDLESGIEVDLNINNAIGIRNTQLLSSYARTDKRLPPLVVLAKLWARHHGINDAKHNTLSSYSIVLMVIHYLQYKCLPPVLPCLQKLQTDKYLPSTDVRKLKLHEDLPDFISENYQDLGELFIGFLKYFSQEFNYKEEVMSVRLGTVMSRTDAVQNLSPKNKAAHWKFLCIEEPFDLTNTARAVFNAEMFKRIQFIFKESLKRIVKVASLQSVLS